MKKKTNHISELTKQLFFFLSFLGGLDFSSMKLNTQDEGEVPTRLNGFDLREFICRCEEDFSRHVKQLVLDTILFSFFLARERIELFLSLCGCDERVIFIVTCVSLAYVPL